MKLIHIAGTNGKGSVALKIAKAFEAFGYKTGLFTSPHLFSPTERIMVNGKPVALGKIQDLLSPPSMTHFFEKMFHRALEVFCEEKVEIGIIEAGIGGLHDVTNAITPILSVITSISKDHIALLGETEEKIAFQKAGIIKPGIPVVIGPKANYPIMHTKADTLYVVSETKGFYDVENGAIARKALEVLGLPPKAIDIGLIHRPPCRFEQKGKYIFDVAHNVDGFRRLLEAMEIHFPRAPFAAIVGISKDKEVEKCLHLLAKKASHLYLFHASHKRAVSPEEMGVILKKLGHYHFSYGLPHDEKNAIVVCGSFFIMEQVHRCLLGVEKSIY